MPDASQMVLLFSGGLDSTALAALLRPRILLYVDYGQRPAEAERTAATNIAGALGLPLTTAALGIREFGSGLLHGETSAGLPTAPSPEWWPYRNQFLGSGYP